MQATSPPLVVVCWWCFGLCWGVPPFPLPCGLLVIRFLFCAPFGTTRVRGPGGSSPLSPEGGMRRCGGLGLWFLLVLGLVGGFGGWVVLLFVALATLRALGASGTRPCNGRDWGTFAFKQTYTELALIGGSYAT